MTTHLAPAWHERCDCGHLFLNHDVYEYRGDGTDTCCVEGCDQSGCPGRRSTNVPASGEEWQPGDPVYRDPPEWLVCASCGTKVLWGPGMPEAGMPCPECLGGCGGQLLTPGAKP